MSWFSDMLGKAAGVSHKTMPMHHVQDAQKKMLGTHPSQAANNEYLKQKEFAQNGIRWKVADARAAGLHPLAALGTNTASYTPQAVVGDSGDGVAEELASSMGQNVGRAIDATRTQDERTEAIANLQFEHATLQNDLLRAQIQKINKSMNPAFPGPDTGVIKGQGDSQPTSPTNIPDMDLVPLKRVKSAAGKPHQEAGEVADYGFVRTPTGLAIVPSKDVKEKIEDQMIPEIMWAHRNSWTPNFNPSRYAPDPKQFPPPRGAVGWKWSYTAQEFVPKYDVYDIKYHQNKQRRMQGRIKSAPWH